MRRILKAWKNEKGLTLVELLAVVVILGIIAAIAVPSVGGIIENSKKDAHIANAQQMISSAKLVAISELTTKDGSTFYIPLDYLIDKGYLDNFENPFTNNNYSGVTPDSDSFNNFDFTLPSGTLHYVTVTKNGNKYTYTVTLNDDQTTKSYDISNETETQLNREQAFTTN
ncbi:type II secretion system protein [Bacillus litorisediminis]|uniref:type II secretion system protein n=1 Tax=Bacillus litorisediminis TaxID=2922713 RepID=UPI001FAFEA70|nr:type II secretion system protein [Bacillus litorisediminis]